MVKMIRGWMLAALFIAWVVEGVAAPVALFDGKTLKGWVQRGGKAKYEAVEGQIVGTSVEQTPNSFLCTEKNYGDFVLELDFWVDPLLNSGVQIRSECFAEERVLNVDGKTIKVPAGRVHGYQNEIDMDPVRNRWWTAGIYDEGRRNWLFPGLCGGDAKAFTEQGAKLSKSRDWNHLKIQALGTSIKTWLNGEPRADFKDAMTPRGFIGLQVHSVGKDAAKIGLQAKFKKLTIEEMGTP